LARDAFAEYYVPNLLEFKVFSEFGKDIPFPNNSAKKSQNIGSKNSAKASFPKYLTLLVILDDTLYTDLSFSRRYHS